MNDSVMKIMRRTNAVLAGGAALALYTKSNKFSDWDLWLPHPYDINIIADELCIGIECFKELSNSESRYPNNDVVDVFNLNSDAYPSDKPIQFIIIKYQPHKRFIDTIFDKFDISICKVSYICEGKRDVICIIDPDAKQNIKDGIMVLNAKTKTINSSLIRVRKYIDRGYIALIGFQTRNGDKHYFKLVL